MPETIKINKLMPISLSPSVKEIAERENVSLLINEIFD
jgi:hypothetical protein